MPEYTDNSNWMKNLPAHLRAKPLLSLAIPGSHNSGAYDLNLQGPIAPDTKGVVSFFARCCSCVKSKVKDWSLTQDFDIKSQLKLGVRYFDIRTAYREENDDIVIVHGLYGPTLKSVFQDLSAFSSQHKEEVIILDISRFFNFTPAIHLKFVQEIVGCFGDGIARASKCDKANSSLDSLKGNGFQFVIIYHEDQTAKRQDFWSGEDIMSPWPDTSNKSKLVTSLNARFETLKPDALNVFQAILSPQVSTVLFHPCGSLKTTLAVSGNNTVSKWLQQIKKEGRQGVNIVMFDFVELHQCAQLALELNH